MDEIQNLKSISVNGAELTYIEEGNGIPVILVHGSVGDFRTWNFQMEPFSKHFRVISYSRRYHYPNKWTGDGLDYSIPLHADDLYTFITALGAAPVHLVGTSYGAYVSLYLETRHPGFARSLVLGEPPMIPWLNDLEGGRELLKEFAQNAFEPARKAFTENRMEEGVSYFIDGVMGPGTFARLSPKAKGLMLDNAEEMKAETLAPDYMPLITHDEIKRVKCPVLLLKGERSPRMFHLIIDELHRLMPESELTTVPDSSHSMQLANPQFYNSRVLEFLQKS
ncbi:MAG: alpha/beta fold hydrolase [Syntrophomonadaceae bacterium]